MKDRYENYTSSEIVEDIILNNPRDKWLELLKLYINKEESNYCLIKDDWWAITSDYIDPNYKSELNIGDISLSDITLLFCDKLLYFLCI